MSFIVEESSYKPHIAINCHISSVIFNLEKVHDLYLTFMTLTILKIIGQLFCRMFFNLGLSNVSPSLDAGYTPFTGRDFLFHLIRWHCFNFLVTKEILDHLIWFLWSSSFFSPTMHQHPLSYIDTLLTAFILWPITYSWPHVNALFTSVGFRPSQLGCLTVWMTLYPSVSGSWNGTSLMTFAFLPHSGLLQTLQVDLATCLVLMPCIDVFKNL